MIIHRLLAVSALSLVLSAGLAHAQTAPIALDRIEAAVAAGVGDRDALVLETLTAFKRAGCSGVLTYHAPLAARLLNG